MKSHNWTIESPRSAGISEIVWNIESDFLSWWISAFKQAEKRENGVLSTRLSPDCGKSSGVFNTSHKGCCIFFISQHKHYAAAFKVQEDILGQASQGVETARQANLWAPFLSDSLVSGLKRNTAKTLMFSAHRYSTEHFWAAKKCPCFHFMVNILHNYTVIGFTLIPSDMEEQAHGPECSAWSLVAVKKNRVCL